ncbi:MAG: CRP-like cAMP-binding protein [Verrucomicrobiales bacterium]|jgi:CRP-like cAMP-binding protein
MSIPSTKEIVTLLSNSDAFSGTPDKELTGLAELFTERSVSDGEIITEEDATGGDVFLVLDGLFGVFTGGEAGDGAGGGEELRVLQRGDVFGEIAAITGGRRMATVRAVSDGILLALSKEDFHRVLKGSPLMVETICNSMARYFEADEEE